MVQPKSFSSTRLYQMVYNFWVNKAYYRKNPKQYKLYLRGLDFGEFRSKYESLQINPKLVLNGMELS
jgi:hypothetical protein